MNPDSGHRPLLDEILAGSLDSETLGMLSRRAAAAARRRRTVRLCLRTGGAIACAALGAWIMISRDEGGRRQDRPGTTPVVHAAETSAPVIRLLHTTPLAVVKSGSGPVQMISTAPLPVRMAPAEGAEIRIVATQSSTIPLLSDADLFAACANRPAAIVRRPDGTRMLSLLE